MCVFIYIRFYTRCPRYTLNIYVYTHICIYIYIYIHIYIYVFIHMCLYTAPNIYLEYICL